MTRQRWVSMCATLALALFAVADANAGVICVKGDGAGTGPCWADPYTYLRDALDAANSGDEIWVAKGTYVPTDKSCDYNWECTDGSCVEGTCDWDYPREQSFILRANVGVFGGFVGSEDILDDRNFVDNETILSGDLNGDDDDSGARESCDDHEDCPDNGEACFDEYCVLRNSGYIDDNAYHVVWAPGSTTEGTRLDGFTIRGGAGDTNMSGAGVVVTGIPSSVGYVDIVNCKIRDNVVGQSSFGGGVFFGCNTTGSVEKTTVIHNYSTYDGGGIAIRSNYQDPFPRIENCQILENVANMSGGAIKVGIDSAGTYAAARILNSTIRGNRAGTGGAGIGTKTGVEAEIINCKIIDNHADSHGGALWTEGNYTIKLINTLLAQNTANQYAAIHGKHVDLINVTVTDNENTGVEDGIVRVYESDDDPETFNLITNSVIWGNTPTTHQVEIDAGVLVVRYSDIEGGEGNVDTCDGCTLTWVKVGDPQVDTNINADPTFVEPTEMDYRCKPKSPVIDRGNNDDVPSGVDTDLAGKARFIDDPGTPNLGNPTTGETVDMGAYEFNGPFSGPHGDNGFGTMNRYLSFVPGSSPTKQAVRVTYTGTEYPDIEDESWWITEPAKVTEASGSDGVSPNPNPPPHFWAATTLCVDVENEEDPPYVDFSDWHGTCVNSTCSGGVRDGSACDSNAHCIDVLYIYAGEILPDGEYEIDMIAEGKDYTVGDNFTTPLEIATSAFGDVVGDCGVIPCSPPEGVIDSVDITAVVDKFKNTPGAPIKARTDVIHNNITTPEPDRNVCFVDISTIAAIYQDPNPPNPPTLPDPQKCDFGE